MSRRRNRHRSLSNTSRESERSHTPSSRKEALGRSTTYSLYLTHNRDSSDLHLRQQERVFNKYSPAHPGTSPSSGTTSTPTTPPSSPSCPPSGTSRNPSPRTSRLTQRQNHHRLLALPGRSQKHLQPGRQEACLRLRLQAEQAGRGLLPMAQPQRPQQQVGSGVRMLPQGLRRRSRVCPGTRVLPLRCSHFLPRCGGPPLRSRGNGLHSPQQVLQNTVIFCTHLPPPLRIISIPPLLPSEASTAKGIEDHL